ncbi:neutral zinc metallopeptidase [Kribbella sp. NPDC051952]|uniref:neutral zinc metallopeptidase n=1 Tax=Kribbella sp. NPDC051952 TaxID=3154851 RepID=UPI00342F9FA3
MAQQSGRIAVVCGVVVVLLAAGGIVVRQVARSDDQVSAGKIVSLTPSPSASPSPSATPTRLPTYVPPSTKPSSPTSTITAKTLATENRAVQRNPLYSVGALPASHCKEPSSRPTSLANVRKYYTDFLTCLNKVWAPIVQKAGFTFWAPRLEVFTGPTRPGCGVTDSAAYCSEGVISMSADFDLKNYRNQEKLWTRTTMAHLVAHEYGHHIQRLVGISAASAARSATLTGDAALAESRRIELQASCFSGAYLGADRSYFPVSGSWMARWTWTIRNRGDEWNPTRSHGKASNHSRWTRRGFDAAAPSACNTFTASAASIA